jgi:HSP20 family molecular chaperone IbpA
MRTKQEVARRPSTEAQVQARRQDQLQQKLDPASALAPPADIFEDADGFSIVLDMPGVTKDRLTVRADRNELVIEGEASIDMPAGMEAAYAEVRSAHYRRTFVLTNELDCDAVEASMKDGVLSIRVPKRAELKPRQIEVQAA